MAPSTISLQGILCAFLAAMLFGASTPLSKVLLGQIEPILLAGLLYLGSGTGLALWRWLLTVPSNSFTAVKRKIIP